MKVVLNYLEGQIVHLQWIINPFFPKWSTSAPKLRRQLLFTPSSVAGERILKSVKVWNSSLASRGGPQRQAFAKLVVLLGP